MENKTSCYNCDKYPMCIQYREINNSIDKNCVIRHRTHLYISLSESCNYYVRVKNDKN